MDLQYIDKNFNLPQISKENVEWFDPNNEPFKIYGVFYDKTDMQYKRMPTEFATHVNEGVSVLHKHTAGGRIRFITNSPFIAIKCVAPFESPMPHMTIVGSHGFSITNDNKYLGFVSPSMNTFLNVQDGKIAFNGVVYTEGKEDCQTTIFMPLYSSVSQVFIGIKKDVL